MWNRTWDRIRTWGYKNSLQITWFLIGFFTAYGLADLNYGNYFGAIVNFVLAGVNYGLRKI